jgi:hypothetical protein
MKAQAKGMNSLVEAGNRLEEIEEDPEEEE